jgi:hypothetical protein
MDSMKRHGFTLIELLVVIGRCVVGGRWLMKARFFNAREAEASRQVYARALPAILLTIVGCGRVPSLEFAEVEGKVTLNSQPLSGVMVRFYPVSQGREQLPPATGMTDAAGTFTLSHDDDKAGALVGPNRAVVFWPSRDLRSAARDGPPPSPPSRPIPIHYTVAGETPLLFEVMPGGRQTFKVQLED